MAPFKEELQLESTGGLASELVKMCFSAYRVYQKLTLKTRRGKDQDIFRTCITIGIWV